MPETETAALGFISTCSRQQMSCLILLLEMIYGSWRSSQSADSISPLFVQRLEKSPRVAYDLSVDNRHPLLIAGVVEWQTQGT